MPERNELHEKDHHFLGPKKEEKLEKEKLAKAITSACNDFRGEPKHTKESM